MHALSFRAGGCTIAGWAGVAMATALLGTSAHSFLVLEIVMHCDCVAAVSTETSDPENIDWLTFDKFVFCPSLRFDVTGVCTPVNDDVTVGVTCGGLV